MNFQLKKTTLALHILLASQTANAVVCTDPTSANLITAQTAIQAEHSLMDQAISTADIAKDVVVAEVNQLQSTMNTMAEIQKLNKPKTDTANLEQQAKMEPSPTMCDSITTATNYYESLDDLWCEADNDSLDFTESVVNADSDPDELPRKQIQDELAELVEDATTNGNIDGTALSVSGVIPGMAEGGYSKSEAEQQRTKTLLKVMFNAGDIEPMPKGAYDAPLNSNSSDEAKRALAEWQKNTNRLFIAYNTAMRVSSLSDPRYVNNTLTKSVIEQLKEKVDYYNSEEFIKTIGNGLDKSCMLQADLSTSEKKMEWLETAEGLECRQQFTNVSQVQRINAEINAFNLMLQSNILDSTLSSELNLGIQTQILNEINNKNSKFVM